LKKSIPQAVDFPTILPTNSWDEFSHLFANNFDWDQFQKISKFYEIVGAIKFIVDKDNSFFWTNSEQRSRVINDRLASIYFDSLDPTTGKIEEQKKQHFLNH
jgi:hypothetical protein